MKGVPVSPRRVFGVAFSDAEDAGRHTWVCRGHPGSEGVRVESVDRLADLPGGEVARDAACRSLVAKILDAPRSAWGLDFAFGLPESAVEGLLGPEPAVDRRGAGEAPAQRRWRALLAHASGALEAAAAPGAARRRAEEEGPAATLPLRDRRRDLRGMAGVLAPLAAQGHVAVLPHEPLPVLPEGTPPAMRARAPDIYVLEVWPEAFLERLLEEDLAAEGIDTATAEGRDAVLRALVAAELVRPMAVRMRRRFADDDSGRALASLLCAVGAWKGCREVDHGALCADPRSGLEGHPYR